MSSNKPIKVKVLNTDGTIFEGEVERISSFNEVGRFDVFPMHANFISIINKELTLYQNNKLIKEIKLDKAVMKVKQDSVKVFLGVESLVIQEDSVSSQKTQSTTQAAQQ
ncbi:MAG TPA: hypothetical protein VLG67_01100 [Candidatus Saccharimonadales bacterium]|nr:hypothetical protein [Candidatus Saccharimonadales bacterium]